jgi:hypothetical protein
MKYGLAIKYNEYPEIWSCHQIQWICMKYGLAIKYNEYAWNMVLPSNTMNMHEMKYLPQDIKQSTINQSIKYFD